MTIAAGIDKINYQLIVIILNQIPHHNIMQILEILRNIKMTIHYQRIHNH